MKTNWKNEIVKLIKFGMVGVLNTFNSLWIYYLLISFHSNYLLATILGYIISSIIGYFLNKIWVFKEKTKSKKSLIRYYIVYLSSLGLNVLLMYLWVDCLNLSDKIAPILTLLITVPYNFIFSRLWIFNERKEEKKIMKQNEKIKEWIRKNWLFLIVTVLFAGIMAFVFALNFFNHPVADDYSNLNTFLYVLNGKPITPLNFIGAALEGSINIYKTWQGTYFSNIIFYLNPLAFSVTAYQVTMMLIQIFYIFSVFYLALSVGKLFISHKNDKKIASLIAMIYILFSISFMYSTAEGLYWFTGASLYLIPFSLSLIFIGILVRFMKDRSKIKFMILLLLAIALGGTSYVTGLFLGMVLLILTIDAFLQKNKQKILYSILLIIFATGFAFNVFCPGNFIRTTNFVETTIPRAVLMAFPLAIRMGVYTIFKTPIIPLCILLVPIFVIITKKTKYKFRYPILLPTVLLLGFVVFFMPCTYSYGTFYEEARVQNIQFFYLIIIMITILLNTVGYIVQKNKVEKINSKNWYVVGGTLLFAMLAIIDVNRLHTTTIVNDLIYGDAMDYNICMNDLYQKLKNNNKDTVTVKNCPVTPSSITTFYISEDENNWVNEALEQYFNKEIILEK